MKQRRRLLVAPVLAATLFVAEHEAWAQAPPASPRAAKLDGARIHYTNYGRGDFALVLVHGWNCDENVWSAQAPALAAQARLITIDLPGHGQSDKPEISYTMDLHARAIEAMLEDVGAKSVVLVGHSNGTPVIRQFYRRHPEKVKGLVIVDGALRPFGDDAMMTKFLASLRGPDYPATVGRFVDGMVRPMKNAADAERIKIMIRSAPQDVAVSEMEGLLDGALWARDKIEVPVLMIMAKQPAWTDEYEEFVRGMVPNLEYQMWVDVSHFVMLDKPDDFNQAVLEFLAKNDLLPR